jgi:hypothetical protein
LKRLAWDWILMVLCAAFAMTSFLVDPLSAFNVGVDANSTNAIVRSVSNWALRTDPLWLENPPLLRVQTGISVFVYGPFYLLTIVALLKRLTFIRVPAMVVGGALAVNVITYVVASLVGYHVAEPALFVTVNVPYLLLAILLIVRFAPRDLA